MNHDVKPSQKTPSNGFAKRLYVAKVIPWTQVALIYASLIAAWIILADMDRFARPVAQGILVTFIIIVVLHAIDPRNPLEK